MIWKKLPCWFKAFALICVLAFAVRPPQSSGDVAAWIQAIGSIGTLLAGVVFFFKERIDKAVDALTLIEDAVSAAVEELRRASGTQGVDRAGQNIERIKLALDVLRSRDFHELSFDVQADLQILIAAMDSYVDSFSVSQSDEFKDTFEKALISLDPQAKLMVAERVLAKVSELKMREINRPLLR